jgi:endonuclease-3
MKKQELYNKVIAYFQEAMPVAETELHYNNPFELLIAVILSAQCTDKRVNMITPPLYRDFPTPEALAASTPEVIYEYIRCYRKTRSHTQSTDLFRDLFSMRGII